VRAAISGLALYVSQKNNPADKEKVIDWIRKALPTVQSDENKDFLLNLLQYVSGDKSAKAPAQYLGNTRLPDAAAQAVNNITSVKPYQVSKAEKKKGFVPLFNGMNLTGWVGNLDDYYAKDGMIICDPARGGHGNLYTEKEYSDFIVRFEFLLTPAANNGLGIRAPLEGDAAYVGMELQILDNEAEIYKDLHPYQYHGSVYGVIPAKRGYLKPVGEWNYQEVIAKGNRITITLNGTVILDGDIAEASKNFTSTIDGNDHPGLSNKTGHIGFLGHGSWVAFKNLRIKELQ